MKYQTNNHIIISQVDTDTICWITACMADTILRPLYDFANSRNLFGYTEALKVLGEWAKEFYAKYHSNLNDWDSFEESEENEYNSACWDDFATDWVNDRFKKYKLEIEGSFLSMKSFANSSTPKIIIVRKGEMISSVFSTIPVMYAVINLDKSDEFFITTSESDTVAEDLCTLFDSDEPMDASIIRQLKQFGY